MKKLIKYITNKLSSCARCYGMGCIELPNGDTQECPICKGRGVL